MSPVLAAPNSSARSTLSRSASPSFAAVPPPPPQRPRTVLPPLSSLSLPGSPAIGSIASMAAPPSTGELHHPRPQYPPRRVSEQLPLLAHPSPSAPSSSTFPPQTQQPPQPDPEVYARAYALLREKLLAPSTSSCGGGCGVDVRKVADAASAVLEAQDARERERERRKRRSRSWEDEPEEGREEKKGKRDAGAGTDEVAFFDNEAPCFCSPPKALTTTAAATPSDFPTALAAAENRRHHSTSPASSSHILQSPAHAHAPAPTHRLPAQRPSLAGQRKRSCSLPPPPQHSQPSRSHPYTFSLPHMHTTSVSSSSSSSSSLSTLPTSRSTPSHLAAAGAARHEALLHVVKSFEAVRACRAEGWKRFAGSLH
ncbi:hypothetical protein JCM6882_001345 [Rhodosporidiobolus microsporus]